MQEKWINFKLRASNLVCVLQSVETVEILWLQLGFLPLFPPSIYESIGSTSFFLSFYSSGLARCSHSHLERVNEPRPRFPPPPSLGKTTLSIRHSRFAGMRTNVRPKIQTNLHLSVHMCSYTLRNHKWMGVLTDQPCHQSPRKKILSFQLINVFNGVSRCHLWITAFPTGTLPQVPVAHLCFMAKLYFTYYSIYRSIHTMVDARSNASNSHHPLRFNSKHACMQARSSSLLTCPCGSASQLAQKKKSEQESCSLDCRHARPAKLLTHASGTSIFAKVASSEEMIDR